MPRQVFKYLEGHNLPTKTIHLDQIRSHFFSRQWFFIWQEGGLVPGTR